MDADHKEPPASHYEYVMVDREQNAKVKEQAYQYMDHLVGWCSKDKAAVLIDIIQKNRPQVVVEIGVWGGMSLVPMATALRANGSGKIYGIDPWDSQESIKEVMNESNLAHWSQVDHKGVMRSLMQRIVQFGLSDQIELLECTSEAADPIQNIDILHVDGNHSDKTSYFDVTKWVPLVRKGGWIIFDDMTWYENGVFTTARATEWLNEHCTKIGEFSDNCIWGVWVKQ